MEQVRRYLRLKNNSISKMFGGIKGQKVPWSTFISKLEEANVWLNDQQADMLADLMDCQDNKDMVDLLLFQ